MYQINEIILRMFDIRNLKRRCNYPNCNKKPEKEIFIYEYTIKKNKGLTKLYLCKDHVSSSKKLVRNIKEITPKSIIESKQRDMK